ncbi:MAG: molybdopterin-guanine dinucleotide biosynthesis protein B [Pseudomonadota bacterium]
MILMGITGHKNAGKTTLTERLVRHLTGKGLTVSTLKRTHHMLDLETPGTDSHRHRMAGAHQTLLASDARLTLMEEGPRDLQTLLGRLSPCDVVLAEGWKHGEHARIEAWRPETGQPPLAQADRGFKAVAASAPCEVSVPIFDLDDISAIAEFILAR